MSGFVKNGGCDVIMSGDMEKIFPLIPVGLNCLGSDACGDDAFAACGDPMPPMPPMPPVEVRARAQAKFTKQAGFAKKLVSKATAKAAVAAAFGATKAPAKKYAGMPPMDGTYGAPPMPPMDGTYGAPPMPPTDYMGAMYAPMDQPPPPMADCPTCIAGFTAAGGCGLLEVGWGRHTQSIHSSAPLLYDARHLTCLPILLDT